MHAEKLLVPNGDFRGALGLPATLPDAALGQGDLEGRPEAQLSEGG
jgi:hypothetical protein